MSTINWKLEVEKYHKELIERTQDFLQIPSVLDESTSKKGQPFGVEIGKALDFILEIGKKDEFFVKNVDGYAGVIELGEGKDMIGVLGHLDVVPAGKGWDYPPFGAPLENGRIYARGAMDDKGPTMAAYFAMKIIKELKLPLSKRIRLIIGTDEESDWRCVEYYQKHEEMPSFGIAPDADFPIINAEKGLLDVELQFKGDSDCQSNLELIEFNSGERLNMVPDTARASIIAGTSEDQVRLKFERWLSESEYLGRAYVEGEHLILQCEGVSVHGSTPEKGINAGLLLTEFLLTLSLQERAEQYLSFINEYIDSDGQKLNIACSDSVSGALTVNAGIFNFSKEEGIIGLNIRVPVEVPMDKALFAIKQQAEELSFTCQVKSEMNANFVSEQEEEIRILQSVYERQTGQQAVLLSTGGATYARALEKGVAFGAQFPGREDLAHQKNEYIIVEDLLKMTAIYAEALYELAK
ncbi:dipeptidase PepV [Alkalihalobacillus pseudalcaliphilus]|uniref:dipeptidase PepV n=1 Tax=Alkalihalobacillus pseudalcaliphilus TaxID=79884 RepID=UPI00064DCC29|nr:dipeptidase PepV [Alkalihalobacillus pseudalcaliphilus]KMK77792.1 dipeptidase PepV [Alkalihalobacillus pseudalcaliphilus]